jgi:hypothetical protein
MSSLGIFIYGVVVTALVATALALLAWGIDNERRDRRRPELARQVFGDRAGDYLSGETAMQARRQP